MNKYRDLMNYRDFLITRIGSEQRNLETALELESKGFTDLFLHKRDCLTAILGHLDFYITGVWINEKVGD